MEYLSSSSSSSQPSKKKEGRQHANPGGKLGREFPKSEEDQSATRQEKSEQQQQQQHPINSPTLPYLKVLGPTTVPTCT